MRLILVAGLAVRTMPAKEDKVTADPDSRNGEKKDEAAR